MNLSSIKKVTLKVSASSNFIDLISSAKNKAQQNYEKTNEDYDSIMIEALKCLEKLNKDFTEPNFLKSLEKLELAQKLKSTKLEPYFYLSWLFLFASEIDLATKYMKVVNDTDPNFEGLEVLKEKISEVQLLKMQVKKEEVDNSIQTNTVGTTYKPTQKLPLAPKNGYSAYGQR